MQCYKPKGQFTLYIGNWKIEKQESNMNINFKMIGMNVDGRVNTDLV